MNILTRNNVSRIGDTGQTIIYGHGFGCNKAMWNLITPAFENTHSQITFDYVGSGDSDLSAFDDERYSTTSGYAEDIIEVCDALNLTDNVIFVGHSVSCSAGVIASLKRPNLFSKMVLIGPSPCFLNSPPHYTGGFDHADLKGLLELMDQNYIGWADYLSPVVSGQGENSEVTNKLNTSFCSTDPHTARIFAEATFFADDRDSYKKLSVPSLILHHADDSMVPDSVAQYLQANLSNNTFITLDVAGHCAHMSHPEKVVTHVQEFLSPVA